MSAERDDVRGRDGGKPSRGRIPQGGVSFDNTHELLPVLFFHVRLFFFAGREKAGTTLLTAVAPNYGSSHTDTAVLLCEIHDHRRFPPTTSAL